MTLLTQVSWNDKQFMDHRMEVEWHYLDLIYGTVRLFRRNPFIHETEGGLCHSVWYIGCPMGLIMTSSPISGLKCCFHFNELFNFEDFLCFFHIYFEECVMCCSILNDITRTEIECSFHR